MGVVPDWLGWSQPPVWYVVLVPGIAGILDAAARRLPEHGGHSPLEGIGMGAVRPLDLGSIEATEEAVLNALWAAPEVNGREGRVAPLSPGRRARSARESGRLAR